MTAEGSGGGSCDLGYGRRAVCVDVCVCMCVKLIDGLAAIEVLRIEKLGWPVDDGLTWQGGLFRTQETAGSFGGEGIAVLEATEIVS